MPSRSRRSDHRPVQSHLNPGQLHFMKLLGFHKVKIDRAEGMYYFDQTDARYSISSVVSARWRSATTIRASSRPARNSRRRSATRSRSPSCRNMRQRLPTIWPCSPGDLDMVFLGSSGSEAMEAALKLAEQRRRTNPLKDRLCRNSFHGKTKGALSITDGPLYRVEFQAVAKQRRVPFGDIGAVESAFENDPAVGVIVLETIQGGGGIVAGVGRVLAGVARALRPARRALGCRRSAVRLWPFWALLCVRTLMASFRT